MNKSKLYNDVFKVFGNKCIMTGDNIKNYLSEIYSSNGLKFYPQIKTLEKFGYTLRRFLDDNKFVYEIVKTEIDLNQN